MTPDQRRARDIALVEAFGLDPGTVYANGIETINNTGIRFQTVEGQRDFFGDDLTESHRAALDAYRAPLSIQEVREAVAFWTDQGQRERDEVQSYMRRSQLAEARRALQEACEHPGLRVVDAATHEEPRARVRICRACELTEYFEEQP